MSVSRKYAVKYAAAVGSLVGVSLHAAQSLPTPTTDPDMLRYAMTQGGLLAVALLLIYIYRRDVTQQIALKNERLDYFAQMVEANTVAMNRMASAVEHLDTRRHP